MSNIQKNKRYHNGRKIDNAVNLNSEAYLHDVQAVFRRVSLEAWDPTFKPSLLLWKVEELIIVKSNEYAIRMYLVPSSSIVNEIQL